VLGNPDFARQRKLFVLAAGLLPALEKVRPVLERLGQRLFVIGDDAGLANLAKLGANVLTATTLECMGEILALLRKGGVDGGSRVERARLVRPRTSRRGGGGPRQRSLKPPRTYRKIPLFRGNFRCELPLLQSGRELASAWTST
jgi:hypothetical protein